MAGFTLFTQPSLLTCIQSLWNWWDVGYTGMKQWLEASAKVSSRSRHITFFINISCQLGDAIHVNLVISSQYTFFMCVNDAEIMNETSYTQWIQLMFTVIVSCWRIYTLNKVKRIMKGMRRLSDRSSSIFITSTERMCNNESSPMRFFFLECLGGKGSTAARLELETRGRCDPSLQSEETNRAEAAGRWPESWTDVTQDASFNSKLSSYRDSE